MAPGGKGSPGITSSSPVENSATRGPRRHVQARHADRGREADGGGIQAVAGLQHAVPPQDVFALAADGHAGRGPLVDADGAEGIVQSRGRHGFAVLLHHHRIGAAWHLRAGEDAGRTAGGQRQADLAGGDALADGQHGAGGVDQVGHANGVAVHRAVVFGRHVDARHDVARQHAAPGLGRGDVLGAAQRDDHGQQARQRVVGADQRATAGRDREGGGNNFWHEACMMQQRRGTGAPGRQERVKSGTALRAWPTPPRGDGRTPPAPGSAVRGPAPGTRSGARAGSPARPACPARRSGRCAP